MSGGEKKKGADAFRRPGQNYYLPTGGAKLACMRAPKTPHTFNLCVKRKTKRVAARIAS